MFMHNSILFIHYGKNINDTNVMLSMEIKMKLCITDLATMTDVHLCARLLGFGG